MTPEQINRINDEIAHFSGWIYCDGWHHPNVNEACDNPPDFYNDLNACHEMEAKTYGDCHYLYVEKLIKIVDCEPDIVGDEWSLIHATAPQRCEALLRTIGRWEEK